MLNEFPSATNFVPLMVRLRLPLSTAVVIRLLMFLAIFVPSSPIKISPFLVSFASMPSSSTTRVKQERIIALRLNNNGLCNRFLGVFDLIGIFLFYICGCLMVNMLRKETVLCSTQECGLIKGG